MTECWNVEFLHKVTLIAGRDVVPAKAGKQFWHTGFPRVKHGAGLVKPGMTNYTRLVLFISLTQYSTIPVFHYSIEDSYV